MSGEPALVRSYGAPPHSCLRRCGRCDARPRTGRAGAGGDLRIGSTQPFDTPNPFASVLGASVSPEATVYYDQLTGLKTKDQSLEYTTALAKSGDVSADGKTITFHLRSGIQWSDGVPFTSADAVWTLNAVLENKTNQLHTTIQGVNKVSAPDANTVVLHLATRDSEFLEKLAIPILPKHIWDKYPVAKLDKITGPIPASRRTRPRSPPDVASTRAAPWRSTAARSTTRCSRTPSGRRRAGSSRGRLPPSAHP